MARIFRIANFRFVAALQQSYTSYTYKTPLRISARPYIQTV